MSTKVMIAQAMWMPSAASSVACPFDRVRLTAPNQRPFTGELRPQAAAPGGRVPAIGADQPFGNGVHDRNAKQSGIEQYGIEDFTNKNSDTRYRGTSVWRPPA